MNPTEFHNPRKFAAPAFGRVAYIEKGVDPTTLFLHGLPRGGYEWRNVIGIWHRDEEVLPSTIPT